MHGTWPCTRSVRWGLPSATTYSFYSVHNFFQVKTQNKFDIYLQTMNPTMAKSKKRTAPTAPTIIPAFNSAWKSEGKMELVLIWHFSSGRKMRRSSEELPKKVSLGLERLLVPAQILITYSWLPCNSLIKNWKTDRSAILLLQSRSINYELTLWLASAESFCMVIQSKTSAP